MKKILSLVISLALTSNFIASASAADPKVVFSIDCNTQERQTVIGYQSNPDDLPAGPEVIALKFTMRLSPSGSTTMADLSNVTFQSNPAYSTFIVAENTKTQNANNIDIKFAGGFTGGNGATHASDLIFVKGINQKEYQIQILSGELYPKNSTTNIYTASNQSFAANPLTCGQTTNTNTNTNTNTTNTNTNTNTNTTTNTTSEATTITMSSNKTTAITGDAVEVTATIKNRKGQSIDWSQTTGSQISPTISNEETSATETKSVLKFTMVDSAQDITLRVTVGGETETIVVKTTADKPAATTETPTTTGTQTDTSLQDRLQDRLNQLNSQATQNTTPTQPGNVHAAAGSLSESGPKETSLLILMSLALALGWKKLRRSELNVDV